MSRPRDVFDVRAEGRFGPCFVLAFVGCAAAAAVRSCRKYGFGFEFRWKSNAENYCWG